jgi:hypothetical protein
MKRTLLMSIVILSLALAGPSLLRPADEGAGAGSGAPRPGLPQVFGAVLDIGTCYDYLAPYGSWIDMDPYGYVWCPRHMGYRWRPYAEGYWLWTDWGWTWMSDYDWGWMPFHYGRWGWDNDCGWFWVPGTMWGPAWVTWRYGDLYCGWAPIPPGVEFGMGVDFNAIALGIPFNFWVFVNGSHFLDRDIHRYVLPYERNRTIVGDTNVRNDFEFRGSRMVNRGIDVETVRRMTGHQVSRYTLADADQPGSPRIAGHEARFYRPSIKEAPGARPKKFLDREQARRELPPAQVFEAPRQAPAASPASEVRKRQAQEQDRLRTSQADELKNMDRRRKEDAAKMQSEADKARVQQEYQSRMSEQQKRHQDEQAQMAERHRQEAEQVRRSSQSQGQEQAPPPRKKK